MRFAVLVKGDPEVEAGRLPTTEELATMTEFNEELARSGMLELAEGLQPTVEGARVFFAGDAEPQVTDGPFAETKELIAGFWILRADSMAEVVELVKRVPNPEGRDGEIEIRPIAEF
ncbi:YciI family protein [Amycolatopsis sp. NPDC058986]|uniref:YciI family protein n=1 Tax=unclassified Amycolatopsis TaxID=2618356 RepID=UPI00366B96A8